MQKKRMLPVTASIAKARIWVCGYCGMKIFYGRLVEYPKINCICGGDVWHSH